MKDRDRTSYQKIWCYIRIKVATLKVFQNKLFSHLCKLSISICSWYDHLQEQKWLVIHVHHVTVTQLYCLVFLVRYLLCIPTYIHSSMFTVLCTSVHNCFCTSLHTHSLCNLTCALPTMWPWKNWINYTMFVLRCATMNPKLLKHM